jgi:hypothetical protein
MSLDPWKQFEKDADVKQAVTSWLRILDTNVFHTRIQATVACLDKCLNVNGDNNV